MATNCSVADIASPAKNALVGGPFGSDLVSKDYVESGVPVIRGTNMGHGRWVGGDFAYVTNEKADSLSANCAKPGDVVFTQRGTLGQVAVVPHAGADRYVISQSQMKLTVDAAKADPLFLYYVFTSPEQQDYIRQHAIQTGVPHTNLGILRKTPLRLPPLLEQKRIVHILGTLDDKIELNRRMNATLEAMARAIFQSWFVDFDPVRRNAEGGESRPEDSLFPDSFEDSEMGEIPKGWNIKRVQDVAEAVFDGPHATPKETKSGAVFLGIRNLTGTGIDLSDIRYIHEDDWPKWTKRVTPRPDDIVFSYEATLGYFALIPPRLRCCLGRRLALVRPHLEKGHSRFWFHQFVSVPFQRFLDQHSIHGATVGRIPLIDFPKYPVLAPPDKLKTRFEKIVEPIWARIHANQAESLSLSHLRDTLLPKLLSGEIRLDGESEADAGNKVLEFPSTDPAGSSRKATDEFVEAVVISQLVRKLATPDYPLGRKRYNKLAYLAHRKSEDDVAKRYLKKAAGPYSPWAKYGGPEKIAVRNGYVAKASTGRFEGLVAGEQIDKIDLYLPQYPVCAALDWVIAEFRYRKNDELELLATVDFAALDLLKAGKAASVEAIRDLIAGNQEWAPKLKREIFSVEGISGALEQLKRHFPATYGSNS